LPADSVMRLELATLALQTLSFSGQSERGVALSEPLHEQFCNDRDALPEWCGLLAARIAFAQATLGRSESAATWLGRANDFLARRLGPDHAFIGISYLLVADAEARAGHAKRARSYLAQGEKNLARQTITPLGLRVRMRMMLAFVYLRLGLHEKAAPHAEATYRASLEGGLGAPILSAAARVHALSLAGGGNFAEAERVVLDAWERVQELHEQDHGDVARTAWKLYHEAGREAEAEHWLGVMDDLLAGGAQMAKRDTETWAAIEAFRARHPARAERARRAAEAGRL
jgi:hypothetical protein